MHGIAMDWMRCSSDVGMVRVLLESVSRYESRVKKGKLYRV